MNSEHYGHETTQQNFFIHQNNRKLTPEDRQFVIDMMQGNASNPNMAAALSQRTGRSLNDPLKRGKKIMKCPQCLVAVHQPCFIKDRSEMGLVGCLECNP